MYKTKINKHYKKEDRKVKNTEKDETRKKIIKETSKVERVCKQRGEKENSRIDVRKNEKNKEEIIHIRKKDK